MLDTDHDPQPLIQELAALACNIELPGAWQDFFTRSGPAGTCEGDQRRFPRFHVRGKAALLYGPGLPNMPRSPSRHGIYLKDICRAGIGFLHSEQLFPRERVNILLADGIARIVEVVHCRRIQRHCYEVGTKFISAGDIISNAPGPQETIAPPV